MNTLIESLAAALAMAAGTMAVAEPPTSTAQDIAITLHVVDEAHVSAPRLDAAEDLTMRIFRDAGVRVLWTYNKPGIGPAPPAPPGGGFWIHLLRGADEQGLIRDGHVAPHVLAFAPEGEEGGRGRTAFILMDRLSANIDDRRTPFGWLLGQVMAHEVGHLLLPVNSHAATGIMRPSMGAAAFATRPAFTKEEAALIRRRLSNGGSD
jgi:hypothetical protein